jgi:hypothetical protein
VEKAFAVKFDYKLGRLVGLPKELEPYADGFKPEDFNNNMQDVMDAMEAARKLDHDTNAQLPLPSETDFNSELEQAA